MDLSSCTTLFLISLIVARAAFMSFVAKEREMIHFHGHTTIKRARMRRCLLFLSFFGTEHVDGCIRCLVPYGDPSTYLQFSIG
jgi:hypothetical protein